MRKSTVNTHQAASGTLKRLSDVFIVLVALLGSMLPLHAAKLTPGYHVFSVLATDGRGTVRTADPKMVVVRRPSTDVTTTQ